MTTFTLIENHSEVFPQLLQDAAVRIINERGMNHEDLAEALDVFPEGARRLLSKNSWPASTGFRVLEALGASVEVSFPE